MSIEKYQNLERDSSLKLKTLQDEMAFKIEETRVKTEGKYSSMIKNYRETKRKVAESESVGRSLRSEIKKIKTDMTAMAHAIKPSIKETEKAVINQNFILVLF